MGKDKGQYLGKWEKMRMMFMAGPPYEKIDVMRTRTPKSAFFDILLLRFYTKKHEKTRKLCTFIKKMQKRAFFIWRVLLFHSIVRYIQKQRITRNRHTTPHISCSLYPY